MIMTLHEAMIIAIKNLGGGKIKMTDVASYINVHNCIKERMEIFCEVNKLVQEYTSIQIFLVVEMGMSG